MFNEIREEEKKHTQKEKDLNQFLDAKTKQCNYMCVCFFIFKRLLVYIKQHQSANCSMNENGRFNQLNHKLLSAREWK